ncbi:YchF/TatD family DNA exonuclease [Shewanella yunxiaonensis]|uniref:YchF/TatD family DNA exonuclease n=1 Tax=Shewanella yunxiaonensis TaxID=2829809 RepID=A0ABX7YP70_9GAMM|nr:YchF/TatD family DNA exonuclease [Shewanella yunxiaonensis]QUN04557.1 YchF/TatD family DNA exonuclease [Shewanella yunxiaonensis]
MLVDSHCHLDRLKAAPDQDSLQQIINDAKVRGVDWFLCVNVRQQDFPSMRDKMATHSQVFLSAGVHPLDVEAGLSIEQLKQHAADPRVVAIGETGLDYFYAPDSKTVQQQCFEQQVAVATEINKPLIIHTRDAQEDTMAILRNGHAEKCGGVLHCFTESLEMAQAAMALGFYISVSGIVTFRNADALRSVIKQIPKERLLVETDSPYLAPIPHRGKENQPAFVRDVAQFVADLRQEPLDELAAYTTDNFFRLFRDAAALAGRI